MKSLSLQRMSGAHFRNFDEWFCVRLNSVYFRLNRKPKNGRAKERRSVGPIGASSEEDWAFGSDRASLTA